MKNHLNSAFKPLTIVFFIALFCLSCKKKEHTVNEWGELATAKINEITVLTASIPCGEQNVSIQELATGCSASYYTVKAADLAKFEKLKKEYFDLLSKRSEAMVRAGYIIDPCFESIWITEQPIRLECKSGTVQVVTSGNLDIEEAKPLAAQTYEEVKAMVNAQTCTSAASWMYTPLIKDRLMDAEYIPYPMTKDYTALKKKVALYNRLKARIIQLQGPLDVVNPPKKVERIECIDGKPVIKFSN